MIKTQAFALSRTVDPWKKFVRDKTFEPLKQGAKWGALAGFIANRLSTGDDAPYLVTELGTAIITGIFFRHHLDKIFNHPKDLGLKARNFLNVVVPLSVRYLIEKMGVGIDTYAATANFTLIHLPYLAAGYALFYCLSQIDCKTSASRHASSILNDNTLSLNQKAKKIGDIAKKSAESRLKYEKFPPEIKQAAVDLFVDRVQKLVMTTRENSHRTSHEENEAGETSINHDKIALIRSMEDHLVDIALQCEANRRPQRARDELEDLKLDEDRKADRAEEKKRPEPQSFTEEDDSSSLDEPFPERRIPHFYLRHFKYRGHPNVLPLFETSEIDSDPTEMDES